jgi:hypothetical protein
MSLKRMVKPAVMHAIGHTTPATAHLIASVNGTRGSRSTTKRRRRSKSATGSTAPRKRRSSAKKGGKLKKGSAAAKAYMAKIRKKRGK